MEIKDIYKYQPWLRPVHLYNLSERIGKYGVTIAYNTIRDTYELHGCRPDFDGRNSSNAVIPEQSLCGVIIKDFRANDLKRFADEVEDYFGNNNLLYDKHEETLHESTISRALKTARRVLT